MKNKSKLIRICVFVVLTLIMSFIERNVKNIILSILSFLLYTEALLVLISWRTFNGTWICDECGEKFKLSLWTSMKTFSPFSFKNKIYYRQLHCYKCMKKTWCRCIFDELT